MWLIFNIFQFRHLMQESYLCNFFLFCDNEYLFCLFPFCQNIKKFIININKTFRIQIITSNLIVNQTKLKLAYSYIFKKSIHTILIILNLILYYYLSLLENCYSSIRTGTWQWSNSWHRCRTFWLRFLWINGMHWSCGRLSNIRWNSKLKTINELKMECGFFCQG